MEHSPLAVAQLYSEGRLSREQLIDALRVFPFVERERLLPPFDDPAVTTRNSFEEVGTALACDFIDEDLYKDIADAVTEHNGGRIP